MHFCSPHVRYVPPQALASVDTTGQSQEIVTDEVLQQEPDDENSLQHISIYEDIQSIQSQVYRDDTENENERVDTSRSGSDTSSERPYLELEPPNTYEDLEKSDRVEMQTYSQ
ncbi:uncharacterized protein LOC143082681 isoform X3 [Mytilus galloprovincialis]|uniref:uncharacterized protein LOC143082681 isoform X3 n=1 Tax=Mytilus galloprovincialis TaxID=29158 RepID=UPI003F7C300D